MDYAPKGQRDTRIVSHIYLELTEPLPAGAVVTVTTPTDLAVLQPVDSTPQSTLTDTAAQALEVTDQNTAPAGLTFAPAATLGAALSLGNLAPGEVRAFWLRREPQNTAAMSGDSVTIRVTGETLP